MAISIDQRPLYSFMPIGQKVIFAVSENTIVAEKFRVKFLAEVRVSNTSIDPNSDDDLIGTFKTTPNNAGVGIFDLRPILETFVTPDYEPNAKTFPASVSEYRGTPATEAMFPIHLVDRYSVSVNSIKYFAVRFRVEYSETATGSIISTGDPKDSLLYTMFNGVLQYDDTLKLQDGNYGFNLNDTLLTGYPRKFFLYSHSGLQTSTASFLSNAPTTQYARDTDYGTLPFFSYKIYHNDNYRIQRISVLAYNGASLVGGDNITNETGFGGTDEYTQHSYNMLMYFGAFPGNVRTAIPNMDTAFLAGNITHYTVQAFNVFGYDVSKLYTINILCPNQKGFEGIRLTWLNQWGVWDYYTFNMKSTRSISTNRTSYTQQDGTWNESTFKIKGYKGGKKNFRVNSTEKIKLNTDFVTEAEGVWFEELINSPEVYIVNGFQADASDSITNKYIEPVVLTTSSYVKKTRANDKVMQYTIEIEKSKMKRTQSV